MKVKVLKTTETTLELSGKDVIDALNCQPRFKRLTGDTRVCFEVPNNGGTFEISETLPLRVKVTNKEIGR